jgi:tetratricopeptide (TPR) repeat protein
MPQARQTAGFEEYRIMLSKIANWVVWSALALFIVFLIYPRNESIKPAASHVVSQVKSAFGHVVSSVQASEEPLNQARDAYARGDAIAAVNAYQAYIKKHSDSADARGELGNVYYSEGNLTEAAQVYYDAANLLIAQKKVDQAARLATIIAQINPGLANELAAKMPQPETPRQSGIEQDNLNQPTPVLPQSAMRYY